MRKPILTSVIAVLIAAGLGFMLWNGRAGNGEEAADDAPGARVLLIGLDGADWDILDPLIAQGRLPHMARLKREGVCGPLLTLADIPLSPVIWTSIATGKGPAQHGITWFLVDTPDGKRIPVRSHNRKVKALWNILAEYGLAPGVVGWWATAPAEPVGRGVIASDALGFHGFGRTGQGLPDWEKVYPAELYEALSALVPPVQQIDYSYGQRFFNLSSEDYYRRAFTSGGARGPSSIEPVHLFQEYTATTLGYTAIASHLLETRPFDLFGVYYEASDSISHLFMKYAPPRLAWVDEEAHAHFKDVVDRYYEFMDEQIGELLAKIPPEWAVVLVSDHGFRIGEQRPKSVQTIDIRGAHLDHAPEGVFMARGPGFQRGAWVDGASVLDVTPTLLHYLDMPIGKDMDGRVLADVFEPAFLQEHPIRYIASYEGTGRGAAPVASPRGEEAFLDEEAMARLRALGYVNERTEGIETAPQAEELSSPEQHNNLGRIHLGNGELAKALEEFQAALAAQPGNGEALTNIGLVHLARGNHALALRFFTEALQANPNNLTALLQLAELRKARGELPLAEAFYRQVLAIDDRLPEPHIGLGDVLLRQGRAEAARERFAHAVELDPRLADAHYNLGVAHAQLGDGAQAKQAYEKALVLVPEHPMALNNLGDLLRQQGAVEEALEHFHRAARASPTHLESRFNIGSIRVQQGQPREAIPWLKEAVALKPDLEVAQNLLAQAYLDSGQTEEAQRRCEMLTRMFPLSPVACVQLARIAVRKDCGEEASQWLRHAWKRGGEPVKKAVDEDPEFAALDRAAIFR